MRRQGACSQCLRFTSPEEEKLNFSHQIQDCIQESRQEDREILASEN